MLLDKRHNQLDEEHGPPCMAVSALHIRQERPKTYTCFTNCLMITQVSIWALIHVSELVIFGALTNARPNADSTTGWTIKGASFDIVHGENPARLCDNDSLNPRSTRVCTISAVTNLPVPATYTLTDILVPTNFSTLCIKCFCV